MERRRPDSHSRGGTSDRRGGQAYVAPQWVPLGKPDLPPPPPKAERVAAPVAPPGSSSVRAEAEREAGLRTTRSRRSVPLPQPMPMPHRKPRNEPTADPVAICRVVYADEALVVADKAAGYPVTPSRAFDQRSVLKSLQAQGYGALYPVSLLDPEASGLVVLSRSAAAAQAVRWNWRSGLCERSYVAVVHGDVAGGRGRISLAIGAVQRGPRLRHQPLAVEEGGRAAVTTWKLLARGRNLSRLLLTLQAGRCHQIRIHLAAMGHPLVGDRRYARRSTEVPIEALVDLPRKHDDAAVLPPGQLALHCSQIRMPHPLTGQVMTWSSAVPRALLALMPGAWQVEG